MVQGLVSIIIPCFNYGRYLRQCVESLFRQSYTQWECVIIDDGSTDETPAICAQLANADPRVHGFRQVNAGLSAARNTGIRHATGEFVQFLDADDLLQPEKLAAHINFLQRNSSVDIVSGEGAYVDETGMGAARPWPAPPVEGEGPVVLATLIPENPLMVHCPVIRSNVIDRVGMFDETLRGHEDWEFWLRCALRGCRFAYCSASRDGLALVREHARNMRKAHKMMFDTAVTVREMIQSKLPSDLGELNAEHLATMRWRRGLELMRAGELREGWKIYVRGLRSTRQKSIVLLRLILVLPGTQAAANLLRKWIKAIQPRR